MENRDVFLENGGERYEYIPCLNAQQPHIDMLGGLVEKHLCGWSLQGEAPAQVMERARKLGAPE